MHVFGSMTQKVAVLVHGAALNGKVIAPKRRQSRLQSRRAIDGQTRAVSVHAQVVEELAPRRLAFSAHILVWLDPPADGNTRRAVAIAEREMIRC